MSEFCLSVSDHGLVRVEIPRMLTRPRRARAQIQDRRHGQCSSAKRLPDARIFQLGAIAHRPFRAASAAGHCGRTVCLICLIHIFGSALLTHTEIVRIYTFCTSTPTHPYSIPAGISRRCSSRHTYSLPCAYSTLSSRLGQQYRPSIKISHSHFITVPDVT